MGIYSNIEYNIPGDTYFACEGGTYYLIYAEWNAGSYELALMEEVDMPSEHRSSTNYIWYASSYDEALAIVQDVISRWPNI